MPRRVLFALAAAAGLLSGSLYYASTQRSDVVVLTRDVAEPRALTAEDLSVVTVAADLAPPDALRDVGAAVGLTPRAPLLRGQIVFADSLALDPVELRGWSLEPGMRAVAVPLRVTDALGGAIAPGARVDVLALPIAGRAPADRTAEVLVTDAPVLDVRGESGSPYVAREPKTGLVADRIASAVIAIAAVDEARFADRLATSTFVLVLVGSR